MERGGVEPQQCGISSGSGVCGVGDHTALCTDCFSQF